jgi:hypothetical protein
VGFAVHWLVVTASAPLAWRALTAFGARRVIAVGGLLCGLAFALLPASGHWIVAIAAYGLLSGLGSQGLGQMVSSQVVIAAVAAGRTRDRALGLAACGAPVGTAVVPAVATLVVDRVGWTAGCIGTGVLIAAVCLAAAVLLPAPVAPRARPAAAAPAGARERPPWMHPSFLLLGTGFALALFVQTAIPFVLPAWSRQEGIDADAVAAAFVILGLSGVAGRVLMTSHRTLFGTRLWIVVPTSATIVVGCLVAALAPAGLAPFYVAVVLLGFGGPVIGALFGIATLACFPEELFVRIGGTLLIPIGIASAAAAALPALSLASPESIAGVWIVLGSASAVSSLAIIGAELASPRRAALRSEADAAA